MSPKDREAFLAWHASKKESNYVFNFIERIVTYCRSDVDILRRCCLEFYANCFTKLPKLIRSVPLPSRLHAIQCTVQIIFRKTQLPSYHRWVTLPKPSSRWSLTSGYRTWAKRTTCTFNTHATAVRNAFASIHGTVILKRSIWRLNFTDVFGTVSLCFPLLVLLSTKC